MEINHIFLLGELFERVQLENIFPDSKTFVDCTHDKQLAFIHERYEAEKDASGFNLSSFVHTYFKEPKAITVNYTSDTSRPLSSHVEMLWDVLTRKPEATNDSLISLPHSYIVPGGRFREVYYWDSFFTMLGLQVSKKVDMIQNMVDNFAFLIDTVGYIPNGNRSYYIGRSQPPFFACMVKLLTEEKGNNVLVKYLPQLEQEYNFWMKGVDELNVNKASVNRVALLHGENILNHYWDENDTPRPEAFKEDVALAKHAKDKKNMYRHLRAAAESGWDFSSRWFKDPADFSTIHTAEIIPVDLNCLLFNLEEILALAYKLNDNKADAERLLTLSAKRKNAVDTFCWNEAEGFYFDYDYISASQKTSLTLAAAFPLYFKIASPHKADKVAAIIERHFLQPGGLITTTKTTQQQWDAPNGWAPLQWIVIKGLRNYGHDALAKKIADSWMRINEKVYKNTGKMMEKYNVVSTDLTAGGGEYEAQDGFGWTNGVYLALKNYK